MLRLLVLAALSFAILPCEGADRLRASDLKWRVPPPTIDATAWVMLEIWPTVKDVTLAAYFLDGNAERNQNLCAATKRVFDAEQDARGRQQRVKLLTYRECLSVSDAKALGYVSE